MSGWHWYFDKQNSTVVAVGEGQCHTHWAYDVFSVQQAIEFITAKIKDKQ